MSVGLIVVTEKPKEVSGDKGMFLQTAYLFISLLWYSLSAVSATRRAWKVS